MATGGCATELEYDTNERVDHKPDCCLTRLTKNDQVLVGRWKTVNGSVEADEVARRIETLVDEVLERVSIPQDGWTELYRDPSDRRLWELSYPHSELPGGGPPKLAVISESEAKNRYSLDGGRSA